MNEKPENNEAMPTLEIATESKASGTKSDDALLEALAAPCEVRMRHESGRHLLSIPELGIMVSGKNLDTAHAELMALREKRIREFAAEGLLHWLDRPAATSTAQAQPGTLRKLKPFFIKCLVVSLLFFSAVSVLSQNLGDVGYVLEKKLQAVAFWSPEQVEWNRARAEQIALKIGPTIRELTAMFHDQPAGAATTAADQVAANTADNATTTNAVTPAPAAVQTSPAPPTTPAAKAEPATAKLPAAKQAPKHTGKP